VNTNIDFDIMEFSVKEKINDEHRYENLKKIIQIIKNK